MKTWSSMRHRRFSEKCTSMCNNASKHDHLWDTEDFKKKCMSMNNHASKQNHLWVTKDFKRIVCPCTIMYYNMIKYETQRIIRKMYVDVQ